MKFTILFFIGLSAVFKTNFAIDDPCKSIVPKCGNGAVCHPMTNGSFTCTCPTGKTGDPLKRCCKGMKHCSCWGDPHCSNFDISIFHFQGICQYNFVSTVNASILPYGLVPFNVYIKQENRNGLKTVSYIRHIEANIKGISYRLLQQKILLVNGIKTDVPYKDANGIQVFNKGGQLSLSTEFGLTILWDGLWTVDVAICDAYARYVNGLCGNGDANGTNDYVDPAGNRVTLVGAHNGQYWDWANKWRVPDTSGDNDPQCNLNETPINSYPLPYCKNYTDYQKKCSYLINNASIWQKCINFKPGVAIYESCQADLCAAEGNVTYQDQLRCANYAYYNQFCNNLGFTNTTWRSLLNCTITCGTNEIFEVRKECPKTCFDINGTQDCGEMIMSEGCYCQPGYALNNNQQCILISKCGCLLPDGSSYIPSGQSILNNDCSLMYTCASPESNITITKNYCPNDSSCTTDQFNNTKCICNDGYIAVANTCIADPCKSIVPKCGVGAICTTITNGSFTCSCPKGKTGDPLKRCCSITKHCHCSGDPHCSTFDQSIFHFQGICQYNFVSTINTTTLPNGLVPFNVYTKQENRNGVKTVAYVRYVEVHINGIIYKLLQLKILLVNGIKTNVPYKDANGIQVFITGTYMSLTTQFGLTILWNGLWTVDVAMCDAYAGYLNGLCGNADGNGTNDYVNPQGNLIPLVGDHYNKYWNWGNTWRVLDESGDNNTECNLNNIPVNNNPLPICRNTTVYQNSCSYITNTASIWQQCINANTDFANFTYDSCVFDLCAAEGNFTFQEQLRCTTYTQFNQYCSNLGFTNTTWRTLLNCPMTCGTNEIFAVRKECPKTCLDTKGTQDCGETILREDCYCKTGYVLNSNQQCILPSNCGCLLPDGSSLIASGQSIMSNNCSFIYTCGRPMSNITITNNYCQNNSSCKTDEFNNPKCICNDGYITQANTCIKITTTTTPTTSTTPTTTLATTTTTPTTTDAEIIISDPTIILENTQYATFPAATTTERIIADTTIVEDKTSTPHAFCDQSKTCYGYGDPHYRTSDGYNFIIKQNCSYLFASDDCLKTSTFQIVVHQKYISENLQVSTINSIDINYNQINYSIDSNFHINNIVTSLPYSSQNDHINVYNLNHYTVFKTDLFELKFDGKQFLKFSHCDISLCGLCGIHDISEIDNYVMKNPEYCF